MMSTALNQIESQPFAGAISGVAREMFDTVAPEMSGFNRVALANLWLFEPVVRKRLEAGASTNAMLRTTTALTVVHAGNKENVLPGTAQATVNFRLLPGDTLDSVLARVRGIVATDKVQVEPLPGGSNPSSISPTQSSSYQLVNRTIRELFPGTVVAPGVMIGASDSRHFEGVSDHIYKFSPVRARPDDLPRFHGTNERISEANLVELIRFYHRLLAQAAGKRADVAN
jgi:carboxypeptidase PM20D1